MIKTFARYFLYITVGFIFGAIPGQFFWYLRSTWFLDKYGVFLLVIGGVSGALGALVGVRISKFREYLGAVIGGLIGATVGIFFSFMGM